MTNNAIPFGVLSTAQAEKQMGISIKKKKEFTKEIMEFELSLETKLPFEPETGNSGFMMKEAILEAITSPYLRAVIAFFVSPEKTTIHISEVSEDPIRKQEMIGILAACYDEMTRHVDRKFTLTFQEKKQTHMIEGGPFAQSLMNKMSESHAAEVFLVNVHHDYARVYSNLGREDVLLSLIREIHNTDSARFLNR